jgi:hypothetical protein
MALALLLFGAQAALSMWWLRTHRFGPLDWLWLWPGDLLTSRLIAAMLLTIAVGAAYSVRYVDTARVTLGTAVAYGFGVALANLWSVLENKPIRFSYLLAFAAICVISGVLLRQIPRSQQAVGTARPRVD